MKVKPFQLPLIITSDSGCCPFCSYSFLPSFLPYWRYRHMTLFMVFRRKTIVLDSPIPLFKKIYLTFFFSCLVSTFCKAFGDFYFQPWRERKTSNRHVPGKIFERERKETSRKNSSKSSTGERKKKENMILIFFKYNKYLSFRLWIENNKNYLIK